jgi:thiamine biosynthesis protein ThiI
MNKVVIIRFGEIFLKGKNRDFFESLLIKNIKHALMGIDCAFVRGHGRYFVEDFSLEDEGEILARLCAVFGINSISLAQKAAVNESDGFLDIKKIALNQVQNHNSFRKSAKFRVTVKRADKRLSKTSAEIAADIGAYILDGVNKGDLQNQLGNDNQDGDLSAQTTAGNSSETANSAHKAYISVDLFNFDIEVSVDIRENGFAYVYSEVIPAACGLPVGCSGKGMLLLSGGIDSPVAAYMMAKRGMKICAVHFASPPYTSDLAKEKVKSLARALEKYCAKIELFVVPFTDIQLEIHKNCPAEFMITIMRRFMMRIAQILAKKHGCGALITGESLGQVASQTVESITCTNAVVSLPVFRPLIGQDKQDIMDLAKKIGTYEISILPYEDCCTIFLPKSPAIKPALSAVERAESALNIDELIARAISQTECV